MFNSFLMAGFECTYAKAENGRRFDLLAASYHDHYCRQDYQMIKEVGMNTVREGFSWSQIDNGKGNYDFSRFEPMLRIGKEENVQQIWDLNHFDYPEYLDPFSDAFPSAYASYAQACFKLISTYQSGQIFITPMNEPSFFAWMCDNGLWSPYAKGRGTEFKKQLVRAAIAAMNVIWEMDTTVKFIHTDPYMYRTPMHVKHNEKEVAFCEKFNQQVRFHSWDMISGRANPELGGDPKYLNMLGVNYYFYNQQLVGINKEDKLTFRSLSLNHKRRLPLTQIIDELSQRYQTDIILAETGSYRTRRYAWWSYILDQVDQCRQLGQPVYGICSYPTLDIVKGAGFIIPESGLWDFDCNDKTCQRIPHQAAIDVIKKYDQKWQTNTNILRSTQPKDDRVGLPPSQ